MTSCSAPHEECFLLLAPFGRDGPLTQKLLAQAGLCAEVCANVDVLCRRFEEHGAAALMIGQEALAPKAVTRLREVLARQSPWSDLPILVFIGSPSAYGPQPSMTGLLEALGNVTLLERPLRPITMVSAARSALRARRRQYALRAELSAQQRAVAQRDQFLAMLGHELRNPLSAIAMALNLDGQKGSAQGASKYRDIMRRQLAHLTRLVDDLLDVSRVTSGKIALRREDVELGALVQRSVATLSASLQAQRMVIRYSSASEPVWVHVDPVRLEQVLGNLLTNASKYTPAGGTIDVRVGAEGGSALVEVRDTGVGIAPDMLSRVFDLFAQVEGTLDRAKGGMGIGLTLVRSLAELHGGSVQAQSPGLGQGSVFTVRLPRIEPPVVVGAETERTEERVGAGDDRYDVLVIEDNPDSRDLLRVLLHERGHRVFTAADGLTGVERALAHRPHVLLVDIGLPGLDGYGVASRVREALGHGPYLIALTGYGQPEDRRRALAAGFDLHLTKPLDVAALDALLREPRRTGT